VLVREGERRKEGGREEEDKAKWNFKGVAFKIKQSWLLGR
jgi:hypothetical protein